MKKTIGLVWFLCFCSYLFAQNVGIGTNTPAYKLDVNGRMRVRTGTIGNNSTSSGIWLEDFRTGINRAFIGMEDSIRVGFYGTGADGIGWGFNFNAVNGNVGIPFGALGIGTISPTFDIHINKGNPSIGFYDSDGNDHFSGSIEGNGSDVFINAFRRPNVIPVTEGPGHIIMQVNSSGPFTSSVAGNVGIGIATPDTKLHITNGTEVTEVEGGYLQLGFSDNANLAFDANEIQARSNLGVAKLFLQYDGGGIQVGSGDGTLTVSSTGEVQRNNLSGTANLLPLAYGRVSAAGTVVSSTGNFTAQKGTDGVYYLTLTDESNVYTNRNNYVIMVTPYHSFFLSNQPLMATVAIGDDNRIIVKINRPRVYYTNDSCSESCGPFSYISNAQFYDQMDNDFNILIYKY
jgi:hypothetical protein